MPASADASAFPFQCTHWSMKLPPTSSQSASANPGIGFPAASRNSTNAVPAAPVSMFSRSRVRLNTTGGVVSHPPLWSASADTNPSSRRLTTPTPPSCFAAASYSGRRTAESCSRPEEE
ncbi:MAG TPA: hypothetical protein VMZ71_13835 [Gemmataceae bacterium]|nr:hypothetical protein [Gemmataceae bacterium]